MDNNGIVDFEYLVLGAGPAGLQLGHHLSRAGRSYLILERGECFALNVRGNTEVVRVEKIQGGFRLTDSEGNDWTGRRLVVAAVSVDPADDCTGFRFDNSFFDEDCRPELTIDDRFPSLTGEWESTNVPGMYFAGMLTQSRDFRKTASDFIHGFHYNTRALFRMLESRYHARPWPAHEVAPNVDGVLDSMVSRLNTSSALWQQYGFLHDLIVMPYSGGPALHLEELPLAYIQESDLSLSSHYYTVSMELGAIEGDPFAAVRRPRPEAACESAFLHPVVRRWNGPLLVAEHHVLEDPQGEWTREDLHLSPLRDFLWEQMRERVRILTDWN